MTLRKKAPSIVIYSLTIIVLIFLIIFANPEKIITGLIRLGIWGIFILILLYIIDLAVRSYRWKLLLNIQGVELPLKVLMMPVISALAVNLFLPARTGEAIRIFSLKRNNNVRYSDTISSIVIEQVLSIIGLLFVVTVSLFVIGNSLRIVEESIIIQQLVFILFIISTVGLLGLWLAVIKPKTIERILQLFPPFLEKRLISMYRSFQTGITDLKSSPSILGLGIVTSASIWIIEGVMLFIIAVSIYSPYGIIDLPWLIAASCAGNITFIIPILPGAVGEYEIVVGIILISAPAYASVQEGATIIALIDRFVKSGILLILGGYSTLDLGGSEILRLRKDFFSVAKNHNSSNNKLKSDPKAEIDVNSILQENGI